MKKYVFLAALVVIVGLAFVIWLPLSKTIAEIDLPFIEREPDIPAMLQNAKNTTTKEEFLTNRAEAFGIKRGIIDGEFPDPKLRPAAVREMDRQQEELARRNPSAEKDFLLAGWTAIGPAPIVSGGSRFAGRTTAIAIHPSNPNVVYVGTAQGGLYRSTNGGGFWTPLMDGAQSLAIGAIAISPTNPETVFVGTGEPNFSSDCFFGVGLYRIENASTSANVLGPFNLDGSAQDVFTGRAISEIVIHPTDSNTIFVSTTSGVGGIGAAANNVLPSRGIYRSTNALGASPTFAKLTGLAGNLNASVRDIAIDPTNANILVAGLIAAGPTGGIYRTANALDASPTFSQTLSYTGTATSDLVTEFAAVHPAAAPDATFYAASGQGTGTVHISTNGGQSWTQQVDNNFCNPQCFYDVAIDVDPNDPNRVYLGGSPALIAGFSTTAGTAFVEGGSGVHVDTQVLAVSRSDPSVIYLGTDGGIYKSTNSGVNYSHLNTGQFFATQFMSVAIHPIDTNYSIGGTQDNGTNAYSPTADGWTRVDGGDGGYAVIDQNATDLTNVRAYHTYFSRTNSIIGYATRGTTTGGWSFRGCGNGTTPNNGINCTDATLFYAPLEGGPGTPNTIYYGTDRVYRSDDLGVTHTVVSQAPLTGVPISAIGISPQNDGIRLIGQSNGGLWGTINGSTTLNDYDPTNQIPNNFIARTVIDPANPSVAYVTLSVFGVANVFKTSNLSTGTPSWTDISGTIPRVPVSAFIVDPTNSNVLYAGTDIGVFVSTNAGTSWSPFGSGLPRVAVFDMAITNATPRKLRVATHGKGMYEIALNPAAARRFIDFDGDSKTDISIFRPGPGEWWYLRSSDGGNRAVQFGNSADRLAPADYTGDGRTDIAFFRPSSGEWFILRSENSTFLAFPFGTAGDIPFPDDFDGDSKADVLVFRPSNNLWFIQKSGGGIEILQFGATGDKPVVGDYDGDAKADIAIYRPVGVSGSEWWVRRSSNTSVFAVTFGTQTDKPVQGDYTGDGKADIAFWRPSDGNWFILRSENGSYFSFPFGTTGDTPVVGDYDGDGRFDAGVFRPSTNIWFVQRSTGSTMIVTFGAAGDLPVPNAFVP